VRAMSYCLAALRSLSLCPSVPFLLHAKFRHIYPASASSRSIFASHLAHCTLSTPFVARPRKRANQTVLTGIPLPNIDPIASPITHHHPVHLRSIALPEWKLRRICFAKHHSPLFSANS
jgi:hypothetical protein